MAGRKKSKAADRPTIPSGFAESVRAEAPTVSDGSERRTTEELKEQFAGNLDWLIGLVGLSRKEAAEAIGVDYVFLRRLVSAGVSRSDERSSDGLDKIAAFFALPSPSWLWREDIAKVVLHPQTGDVFINTFRARLIEECLRRLALAERTTEDDLPLLCRAVGLEPPSRLPLTGEYADKTAAVLASPKGNTLKKIINDYYELITMKTPSSDIATADIPPSPPRPGRKPPT